METATCDWCRARKVKCNPIDEATSTIAQRLNLLPTCQRCFQRKECCTFTYVMKRPGRPRGSLTKQQRSSAMDAWGSRKGTSRSSDKDDEGEADEEEDEEDEEDEVECDIVLHRSPKHKKLRRQTIHPPHQPPIQPQPQVQDDSNDNYDHLSSLIDNTGPDLSSLFGSARATLVAPPRIPAGSDLAFLDAILSKLPSNDGVPPHTTDVGALNNTANSVQPQTMFDFSLPLPPPAPTETQTKPISPPDIVGAGRGGVRGVFTSSANHTTPPTLVHQTSQSITSSTPQAYTDASLSSHAGTGAPLFQNAIALVPIVDVSLSLNRDDSNGKPRLTALPSIELIAPWQDICFFVSLHMKHQHALVPLVHKPSFAQDMLYRRDEHDEQFRGLLSSIVPFSLMGSRYLREQLETFFFRAQNLSRAAQLRNAERPTLTLLASVILDAISCQAADSTTLTDLLMSEARRLVFHLRLNHPEPQDGMSVIDRELSRRLYWEFWAVSKTAALNGHPLLLYELEGVPPLPMPVDDEYLSVESNFPQPAAKLSYMTGFITVTKIFRILGQCLVRHRAFLSRTTTSFENDGRDETEGVEDDRDAALEWTRKSLIRVRELAEGVTRPSEGINSFTNSSTLDSPLSWMDIQCANCLITALCTEFSILDYKASLSSMESVREDRETTSKRAYQTLSSMPVEYLASNGESMRGKVLRIILSLLCSAAESEQFGEMVWEWWNMSNLFKLYQRPT